MRPEAAMHRDAVHLCIRHFAGLVARHVIDQPRRQDALAVQRTLVEQALVQRGDAARGAVTAAAGQTSDANGAAVVARLAVAAYFDAAMILFFRDADVDIIGNTERRHDALADGVAIILAGDGFDDHRL